MKHSASSWQTEKKDRKERERESESGPPLQITEKLVKIKYVVDAVSRLGREGRKRLCILS